jgi:hypothetical protein
VHSDWNLCKLQVVASRISLDPKKSSNRLCGDFQVGVNRIFHGREIQAAREKFSRRLRTNSEWPNSKCSRENFEL